MKKVLVYGVNRVEGEFVPYYFGCGFGTFFACDGREFKDISEENDDTSISNTLRGLKESPVDKLKRYQYELDQIDLKISHLQAMRKEYIEKMEPLKMELATLLDELSGYGG